MGMVMGAIKNDLLAIYGSKILLYVGMMGFFLFVDYFGLQGFDSTRSLILVLPMILMEAFGEAYMTGWQAFERQMGISALQRVGAKYLLQSVLIFMGFALYLLLSPAFSTVTMDIWPAWMDILIMHLVAAIFYPIIYAFPPKGIWVMTFVLFGSFFAVLAFAWLQANEVASIAPWLLAIATVVIYLASIALSIVAANWSAGRSV